MQGFTWSDFSAKPNHRYTYRVVALTGTPQNLQADRECAVEVTTEASKPGRCTACSSRSWRGGVGGRHALRFRDRSEREQPERFRAGRGCRAGRWKRAPRPSWPGPPTRPASASPPMNSGWSAFADLLKAASDCSVDVRALYDARANRPTPTAWCSRAISNLATATTAGLGALR